MSQFANLIDPYARHMYRIYGGVRLCYVMILTRDEHVFTCSATADPHLADLFTRREAEYACVALSEYYKMPLTLEAVPWNCANDCIPYSVRKILKTPDAAALR